jgi:hypothetical protein
MKKLYAYLLCTLSISLITVDLCEAQSTALALKSPKNAVVIDGSSQEWGDSLSYYNPDKKIHYAITNDKTNLYLAVKTKDPIQQSDILNAGITFSVDTKGRKKSAYSTTFPFSSNPSPVSTKPGQETQEQKQILAGFTKYKKIAVSGFKDISDDEIGTTNTYAIAVAVNYDPDGSLVYEEAIPLELFHAGDLAKGEWSFNIKLNGIEPHAASTTQTVDVPPTPTGRGGGSSSSSSGRGGGRKGTDASQGATMQQGPSTPTIDFWGKFTLAKVD